jgi:cyclic pyranopterin phosphate synthase
MLLQDSLHRSLRDLRLSVTDRCNFRCTYCMPKEVFGREFAFLPRNELLSFEELARVAQLFIGLGIEKIRLTGGEPLLRKNLERLVEMLAPLPGLRDLTLTTNGSLLARLAPSLRAAGLKRITVSLDSLEDATFAAMNDVGFPVADVLRGIDAAVAAGFTPIKINCVVRRGVNEEQIEALVRRFSGPEFIVRFIEYMDVGNTNGWRLTDVVPAAEIVKRLSREFALVSLAPNYPGEVTRRFRTRHGGEIGVITSVTQPFCGDCTRARLSSDGKLYTCLFASSGTDLRAPLRIGASDTELTRIIAEVWNARSDRYSELRASAVPSATKVEMAHIGG